MRRPLQACMRPNDLVWSYDLIRKFLTGNV